MTDEMRRGGGGNWKTLKILRMSFFHLEIGEMMMGIQKTTEHGAQSPEICKYRILSDVSGRTSMQNFNSRRGTVKSIRGYLAKF